MTTNNLENESLGRTGAKINEIEPTIRTVAIKINPKYFKGDRNFLIKELLKRNIETRPGFYPFSLLSYPALSYDDIDYICHQLKSLMGEDCGI